MPDKNHGAAIGWSNRNTCTNRQCLDMTSFPLLYVFLCLAILLDHFPQIDVMS